MVYRIEKYDLEKTGVTSDSHIYAYKLTKAIKASNIFYAEHNKHVDKIIASNQVPFTSMSEQCDLCGRAFFGYIAFLERNVSLPFICEWFLIIAKFFLTNKKYETLIDELKSLYIKNIYMREKLTADINITFETFKSIFTIIFPIFLIFDRLIELVIKNPFDKWFLLYHDQ